MSSSPHVVPRISPSSAVPFYLQLEELLLRRVSSGEWPPGGQIPTESELCELYGVSRVTVRQALARLVQRSLLTRGRGKGTFVRDSRVTANARSVSSFSTELVGLGMKPGAQLLGIDRVQASDEVAAAMNRDPGTELFRLRRLRTADGQPIAVQTSLLVAEMFPGLDGKVSDNNSLYELLGSDYGVSPVEAMEVFRVAGVPRDLAPLLEVARGSHAFHVVRVSFAGPAAFEHTTSFIRGDRYEIRLPLRNP
jgi:GntR family transcriptional regulator